MFVLISMFTSLVYKLMASIVADTLIFSLNIAWNKGPRMHYVVGFSQFSLTALCPLRSEVQNIPTWHMFDMLLSH